MQVVIELVLNHTSDQHPWFQRARSAPPGSPERDYYVWSDTDERYRDARIIFVDSERSNWTWDPVAKAYYWHRFFHHQPDLNSGFSQADPDRLYSPVIIDPVYGYQVVNVEAEESDSASLLHWMRNMIRLRRLFKVFGRGTMEFLQPANRQVLAYIRRFGDDAILCVGYRELREVWTWVLPPRTLERQLGDPPRGDNKVNHV